MMYNAFLRGLMFVEYIFGVIFSTSSHGYVNFLYAESFWYCFARVKSR